jgi:hypothetical protein
MERGSRSLLKGLSQVLARQQHGLRRSMRILLAICVGLIACGAYILFRHPNAAVVGLLLIAIPGVIIVQASLLSFAMSGRTPAVSRPDPPAARQGFTELFGILQAYANFKVILGRLVGYIAIVYGVVTWNAYFVTLGTAAVVLFWIWDRMTPRDSSTTETTDFED